MSNQEVTYTTVKFLKSSSELQNRGRHGDTPVPREADHKECSVPWRPIAVALGVLCSVLLMAVIVVLVIQIQEKTKLQETLTNISQGYHIMQKEMEFKEEMLKNKSLECERLKNLTERNRCLEKNKITLNCLKHTGKLKEGHWFCCGTKCYYFIKDDKTWNECKKTCHDCSLSLLRIDDSEERNVLQVHVARDSYWIGLSYITREKKWKWIDSGISNLYLTALNLQHKGGNCAFFTSTRIVESDCGKTYYCLCEKRMD